MIPAVLGGGSRPVRRILCIGAHSDDIEIGCGGTILRMAEWYPEAHVRWVVLSGNERRADEARCGASLFLKGLREPEVVTKTFRDGFFPYDGAEIKTFFEQLKHEPTWDVILTHYRGDLHQDHRVVSELTWNTFRDHLILEYEIPKYDGGLGSPNLFVPLDEAQRASKVEHLLKAFGSQRDKRWFTAETFNGLMRLRGIECASPTGYAEAFYARKVTLA
jgi:LmbE family N-acetylglucosaminyl deacetylase